MNDGMGSSIFKEWARRYAPGLIETQTAFPTDPSLGIPAGPGPIEGVFSRSGAPGLSVPKIQPAKIEGPTAFPSDSVAPPMETPAATETPLVDYAPQPTAETTPVEGEKKSGGISPGAMGLLGMGLSMAATPPRAVPYSTAEIIGRSGLAGLGVYEKALEDKRRQDAMNISAEEHKLSREQLGLYREGMLEDKATKRVIDQQNADALEEQRKARAASLTGKLVPVKQADGSIAYERMLDAVGQEVPQKPEKMIPVKQADGSVTYAPASEAAGQAVPQKAAQKYKNVPGVGMVDISGPEPVVKIPSPVYAKGGKGGVGGKPTANIQNIEYLVGHGWDRKEAEDIVLHGKQIPRENFISKMVHSTYSNEFVDKSDKSGNVEEAITFYDKVIAKGKGVPKPAAAGKTLDAATAQSYLQKAGGDKNKAREMARKDGYTF